MLDSIWQLLSNNGLNTADIAESIRELFYIDEITGEPGGKLRALAGFPILGTLLELLAGFAPALESNTLL